MKENIQDERVQEILRSLSAGKTRDELASGFGHANYKTLDIYMRRKGFKWDADKQNYTLDIKPKEIAVVDTSRAASIIRLIEQQEELDLPKVASMMKFNDYLEMANYMKSKHYEWSKDIRNYVKANKVENAEVTIDSKDSTVEGLAKAMTNGINLESSQKLMEFLPILKMLKNNEERLIDLLQPYGKGAQLPRYTIKGVAKTKTVQMIHSLDQMVTNFASENNMTQRDLFEIALVDFFKRYGYEKEVEQLFN